MAEGNHWYLGDTSGHQITASVDYGILDRLSASASATLIAAKYEGQAPVDLEVDDGSFHSSLQDARMEARYQILTEPAVITPFVGYAFPLRDYSIEGHASIGRGLEELQVGVNIGRQLAPVLRRAYVHGRYAHGFFEEIAGLDIRRSLVDLELGYFVTAAVGLSVFGTHQANHGGLDWISENEAEPGAHGEGFSNLHNQVVASRFTRLGGRLSLSLSRRMSISLGVSTTVWGENIEEATLLSLGTAFRFATPWASEE